MKRSDSDRRMLGCHRKLHVEQLESRTLLRASPLFWADTSQLTLSFVQDGVDVAGEPSSLHALLNPLGTEAAWQRTILRAFQTWVETTGSNVGVVTESGQWPLGTEGPRTRDPRFGDIRIAARPLSPNVKAIAVAHDTIVSGTWGGDVIFNSEASFDSLRELYSIAVHEAGHVFGLEHSDDPESPMHQHGVSTKTRPTEADLLDVQRLHGMRLSDANEGDAGNDQLALATPIRLNLNTTADATIAKHLLYGDLTTAEDVDFFSITLPRNARGPLRIRLQSQGISLLNPTVRILGSDGHTVAQRISRRTGGDTIDLQVESAAAGDTFSIEVRGTLASGFRIGGYSLVTSFGTLAALPTRDTLIDQLATARERELTQDALQRLLADNTLVMDPAENVNDSLATAVNLPFDRGYDVELYARYEAIGSIHPDHDVDYYVFRSADLPGRANPILNLTVRSLSPGTLIPMADLIDRTGTVLPAQTLVNGAGELVLQAAVPADQTMFLRVRAAEPEGVFDEGNYRITVTFVETPLDPLVYASGQIGASPDRSPTAMPAVNVIRPLTDVRQTQDAGLVPVPVDADHGAAIEPVADDYAHLPQAAGTTHQVLYVATPQLFHWILTVGPGASERPELVMATLLDADHQLVHQVSASPGSVRTNRSVLLMPGTYFLRFDGLAMDHRPASRLRYQLQGLSISDPFAVDPEDPSTDPFFECPDLPEFFCYPGGIISDEPFLWDEFLDILPEIPGFETDQLIEALLGDWWSWYWDQAAEHTPPLAISDTYQMPPGQTTFHADVSQGVLQNDVFEAGVTSLALLAEDVDYGDLELFMNGSFHYTPEPDFLGVAQFRYWASDIQYTSEPATVLIAVTANVPGDLNGDAQLNVQDVDLLCAAILAAETVSIYDLNFDGDVDHADLSRLVEEFLATSAGDANLDGFFNSTDLVAVFGINEYEDQFVRNSTWSTGDWNCDGEFTTTDLVVAFQTGRYELVASG